MWRRVYGPIPKGPNGTLEVDHRCDITLCQRPDHLQVLTKPDNTKRRGPTRGPNKRVSEGSQTEPAFAIALFAGIDRPAVEQKTVSLDELRQLLSRFEVLADKRRGRCWSPTRYADGASSRGNAGVLEVSALVFDMDRVPPDPERLAGVYWLGHTTWSHTPRSAALACGHPVDGSSASHALARRLAARTCSAVPRSGPVLQRPESAVLPAQP